jgi:hypothetical protein
MLKGSLKPLSICLLFFLLIFPLKAQAQLVMGQYEDEAPLGTWNTFGLLTGCSLSMGGAHYAHALDLTTALTNPSQLSRLPGFTAVLNGSLNRSTLFKYSLVNTGPISTNGNSSIILYSLDFGGISINFNGWGLALNTSILENYDRPSVFFEYKERGSVEYRLDYEQTGLLRNINLSLSKNLGPQILIGLGLNFVTGEIKKTLKEDYYQSTILITDDKSHKLQGFYLNGGLTYQISDDLQAAAVFRTPYNRTSDSESLFQYEAVPTGTDIKIESQESSSFRQPLILGTGLHYRFSDRFRAAVDITFFNWAQYKATLFGEKRPREFKNVLTLGTGIEFMSRSRIFGLEFDVPLWLGFSIDPQPMKDPHSSYFYGTLGTGLVLDHFYLHAGASLGTEKGSGDHLKRGRVILTVGYRK